MPGADSKGAPEERCLWGWTYVARGSALLVLPIEPPAPAAREGHIAPRAPDAVPARARFAAAARRGSHGDGAAATRPRCAGDTA